MSQGLLMMTDYWVNWWAVGRFASQQSSLYVIIFAILVALCIVTGFLRALYWFQYTLRCSSQLHSTCLYAVLHSPLLFFVSNPTGRILNRFTKDQNQADEALPFLFFSFLESSIYCLSGVILVCISIPYLILLLPFLLIAFAHLRSKYICSTREIKRMEASSRSFIYANFSATLQGIYTLRAYALKARCKATFENYVNRNGQAWFSFLLASRWLGFRLDLETNVILLFVCFCSVLLSSQVNTGLIGFTLVYIIQLSGLFQWTVRQSAEIETQMTSIERIVAYSQLPAEAGYIESMSQLLRHDLSSYAIHEKSIVKLLEPYSKPSQRTEAVLKYHSSQPGSNRSYDERYYHNLWIPDISYHKLLSLLDPPPQLANGSVIASASIPSYKAQKINALSSQLTGRLILRNLVATYREDLPPVLNDISLVINAGSKVGICGRTGSGKGRLCTITHVMLCHV
jgi:ABC-type multidrug transport system fused ATPase/permease subunit